MSCCTGTKIRIQRVVFFSLLISFLFFFLNYIKVSILFYLGLAWLLLSVIALSEKEMFLMISFLMPNLFMFKWIGAETAILGYFFVLVGIKSFIKKYKHSVKVNLFLFLHICSVFLTCVLYMDTSLLTSLVRFVANFSLFSYYATLFSRNGEIKLVVKMYCAGIIIAILMGMVFYSAEGILYGGYFGGVNIGRNYFGAVVTPTITIVMMYILEKNISFREILLYGITLVLCMISVVLSLSRTSMLSFLLPALMCFLYILRSVRKFNKRLIPLLLLFSVIAIWVFTNYEDMVARILKRFEQDDLQTGNGRFVLWQFYLKRMARSPVSFLLGSGSALIYDAAEHNTIVQSLHQVGALGSVTLLCVLKQSFRRITEDVQIRFLSIFPLLSIIFPYCGINALYTDQLSYLLVLSALIMKDFSKTELTAEVNCSAGSLV